MPVVVDGKTYLTMGDAAFVDGLDGTNFDVGAGYFGGPEAYHVWSRTDWRKLPGWKLPIWVAGYAGHIEADAALKALRDLGVPEGKYIALDMERRVNRTYVENFGRVMQGKYRVMIYGSVSTVFNNPNLNGYWVAWYRNIGPFMCDGEHVRATQYQNGPRYDASVMKMWLAEQHMLWR